MTTGCFVQGCRTKHYALGLCMRHYQQFRQHGRITHIKHGALKRKPCTVEGCDRLSMGRGMCHMHYKRWARWGDVTANHRRKDRTCSVEGCDRKHWCKGYCKMHHQRWLRHGDPLALGVWGKRGSVTNGYA